MSEFTDRLKGWRKRAGLTQDQAAERLGITRAYYNRVEGGMKEPGELLTMKFDIVERGPVSSVNKATGYIAWAEEPTPRVTSDPGEAADIDHRFPKRTVRYGNPRERLKEALRVKGWTPADLAKKTGYEIGVMQNLVDGSGRISAKMAREIARVLPELTEEELLGGSDSPPVMDESGVTGTRGALPNIKLPPNRKGRMVPLISMAMAGSYNIAHSDEMYVGQGALAVDSDDRQAIAIELDGDSMSPRLNPGDIVVLAPNSTPRVGDMVVVQTIEGLAYCKIWQRQRNDGTIVLSSINPDHKDLTIPMTEVAWIYPVDSAITKMRRR